MLNHVNTTGDHMAYDTDTDEWVSIYGGLPRHTASESGRVLGIVNTTARTTTCQNREKNEASSGSATPIDGARSRSTMKRDGTTPIDLPVRYDAAGWGSSPSPCR